MSQDNSEPEREKPGENHAESTAERVAPLERSAQRAIAPDFPWRWYGLNALLLFLLCVAAPALVRARTGGGGPWEFAAAAGVFWFGVFLCGGLVWQSGLHWLLRGRVRSTLAWAFLFLCPALLGGGWAVHTSLPAVRAAAMFAHTDLPPLPSSAAGVRHCRWWCPDQVDEYLRFAAEPNAVEAFLDAVLVPREVLVEIPPDTGGPAWYQNECSAMSRRHAVQSFADSGLVTLRVAASDAHVVLIHRSWMQIPPSERDKVESALE